MSWRGPTLDEDQRDLVAMLTALAHDRAVVLDDASPDVVSSLIRELAELGIWTLGCAEELGGGGADRATTLTAFACLGRYWPALGWAAAQAHAAVAVLGDDDRTADLVAKLHAGEAAVAVVARGGDHVRLSWRDSRLVGSISRVDAATASPHVLVLAGDEALLLAADDLTTESVARTGLGGSFTRSIAVDVDRSNVTVVSLPEAGAVQHTMLRQAAAVAAGIAAAAADGALEYATDRRQFGDALIGIPTVRQSLLEQAAAVSVTLSAVIGAADDAISTNAVVRRACDEAVTVAASALQSHGGYGYLVEYAAERHLRDAISLRAACDAHGASLSAALILVGRPPSDDLIQEAS